MLDFLLVLGLVPGTDYQITFNQILLFVALLAFVSLLFKQRKGTNRILQKNISLQYLESLIVKQSS
jgi:Na+/pantothenate symporter